jgi:hypothetical protein
MRATTDACVYSPFYEDGVGEIVFDVVNGWTQTSPDSICVEIATRVKDGLTGVSFGDGLEWDEYDWGVPVPCDMFVVENKNNVYLCHWSEHLIIDTIGDRALTSCKKTLIYALESK